MTESENASQPNEIKSYWKHNSVSSAYVNDINVNADYSFIQLWKEPARKLDCQYFGICNNHPFFYYNVEFSIGLVQVPFIQAIRQ
ncbi:hypothetical protein OCF84_21465 (plasmid) [Shewanella xiamenensis]|uniref:Uncharacterized protein n=1 Tax=Shewanella xiamenensis TaxID=332186 RepID=A0ABT6UDK9_9GAMM|nr:hypothetical protein [Shewanella xiamenensis]MDI5832554.1 hypothetical protein [Shewanella xiamenensis]WHF57828.1 hypothetical protein OCF84_21465 [Shewanella xiamenensis]